MKELKRRHSTTRRALPRPPPMLHEPKLPTREPVGRHLPRLVDARDPEGERRPDPHIPAPKRSSARRDFHYPQLKYIGVQAAVAIPCCTSCKNGRAAFPVAPSFQVLPLLGPGNPVSRSTR